MTSGTVAATLYTPREQAFRAQARQFARERLEPLAEQADAPGEPLLRQVLSEMGARGYMGIAFPKDVGGAGQPFAFEHIASEEFAYCSASLATARSVSCLFCGAPIQRFGSREQKRRFLAPLIRGEALGAIAISEPDAGSDVGSMRMRATRRGDSYVLTGHKTPITNGGHADTVCVFAITDPDAHIHKGMSAFIVPSDTPGFSVAGNLEALGLRGLTHSHLRFQDVAVPRDNLLGEEGDGFRILTDELASERIDIASRALGCARRLHEESVRHSATRQQFGRPLRQFEAVSFQIADMKVNLEASRHLILHAVRLYDAGLPADRESAAAKLFATRAAFLIADAALQIHGRLGYFQGPIERLFRDVRAFRIAGGTEEMMKFIVQREEYKALGY